MEKLEVYLEINVINMKVRKYFIDLKADGRIQPLCDSTVDTSLYCDEQELWSWGKKRLRI
jgi:hypothetical protein